MEPEDFEVVSLIIQGFVITILCIFGIIGSILSALVLTQREMRSAVSSLLIGLTLSDTIFILGQLQMVGIFHIVHYLNPVSYYVTHFQPYSLPYWWYASSLAQTAGLCFAVSITIERYIAICHPFYAKTVCSWKQANYLSIVILFFSAIYALPNMFAFETVLVDNVTNTHGIDPTSFGESELFEEYYEFWANMVVHVFIPFTILIILNLIIISRMRAARKIRLKMTTARMSMSTSQVARQQKQLQGSTTTNANTTNMLICIVIVFSICYTPVTIYRVWERAVNPTNWTDTEQVEFYNEHKFNLFILLTIGRVTVTTNSSMNFIIYCVMGRKFRNLLFRMFHLRTKRGPHYNYNAHHHRAHHRHRHQNGAFNLIRYKIGRTSVRNNNSITIEDPDPDADDGYDLRRERSVMSNSEDGF